MALSQQPWEGELADGATAWAACCTTPSQAVALYSRSLDTIALQTPSTGAPRAVAAPGPSPVLSGTRVTTRSGKQNPALLGQGLPRTCTRWARGQVAETTGSRESGLNSASPSDPKSSLAPRANRPSLLLTSLSSDRPCRRQRDKGGCLPRRRPLGRDEQAVHQDRRAARAPTRKQTPGHCPRMAGPKLWGPLTLPGISMVT